SNNTVSKNSGWKVCRTQVSIRGQ
ncbi:unnamed protein product, partial [Allacma fusca]